MIASRIVIAIGYIIEYNKIQWVYIMEPLSGLQSSTFSAIMGNMYNPSETNDNGLLNIQFLPISNTLYYRQNID